MCLLISSNKRRISLTSNHFWAKAYSEKLRNLSKLTRTSKERQEESVVQVINLTRFMISTAINLHYQTQYKERKPKTKTPKLWVRTTPIILRYIRRQFHHQAHQIVVWTTWSTTESKIQPFSSQLRQLIKSKARTKRLFWNRKGNQIVTVQWLNTETI